MVSGFLKAIQQFSPLSSLYIVHMEMLLLSPWNTTMTPVVFLWFEFTNSLSELFFLPTFPSWRRRFPTVRSVFNNQFYIQFFSFHFFSLLFFSGCFRSKKLLIASWFNNFSFSRKWSVTLSFHISLFPRRGPISSHEPADLSILIDCVDGEKLGIIITNARHMGRRAACLAATA